MATTTNTESSATVVILNPEITGTNGVIGCSTLTTALTVGQIVTITGAFSSGGITGYNSTSTEGTTYYVIGTPTTTTFQLSASRGGAPVTSTVSTGVITGATMVASYEVVIYTRMACRESVLAKKLLRNNNIKFKEINITGSSKKRKAMSAVAGAHVRATPQLVVNGQHIGSTPSLKTSSFINPHAVLPKKVRTSNIKKSKS
jgi:glutaredoxin